MTLSLHFPPNLVFTEDALFRFCQANRDVRIERDERGNLLVSPLLGLEANFSLANLGAELHSWNRSARIGKVSGSDGGYMLPDASMRAPCVAWVSHERLATVSPDDLKRFAHVCPDFVIELLSENDTLGELQEKMEQYLKNGVRLGWLIDPKSWQTHVYRLEREPEILPFEKALSSEDVLPGFELNVARTLEN
ncbi:MAG: Uma2 family endonuclease [Cytophagaceae bacterium]|nr:Uma2 family endonuclease [Cytophagaceae bacterium]